MTQDMYDLKILPRGISNILNYRWRLILSISGGILILGKIILMMKILIMPLENGLFCIDIILLENVKNEINYLLYHIVYTIQIEIHSYFIDICREIFE